MSPQDGECLTRLPCGDGIACLVNSPLEQAKDVGIPRLDAVGKAIEKFNRRPGRRPLLLLAVPAALGASCAFMLPVATPPNAIVYGSSFITIPQMAKAGVVLNLLFALAIPLVSYVALLLSFGL